MTDLLRSFPALWSLFGVVMAAGVFLIASKRIFTMQGVASENLAKTLQHRIDALEVDRTYYRERLHAERVAHQVSELRVKELESQPDLTDLKDLLSTQRSWMETLGDAMKAQGVALVAHSDSDAKIFASIDLSMQRLPVELDRMSRAFDARQEKMLQRFENAGLKG